MTFPVVGNRNTGKQGTGTTTHVMNLPDGITNGQKVVVAFAENGTSAVTWPAGWTQILARNDAGVTSRLEVRERVIDGSEGFDGTGDTISLTTGSSTTSVHRTWRLTGAHASTTSEEAGTGGFGTGPDAPSLNPVNWDVEDTMWVAIGISNAASNATGFPTSYTNTFTDIAGSGVPPTLYLGERQNAVAAEDPAAFTLPGSANYRVHTVGIRPAADVGTTVLDPFGMSGFFGA